MHSNADFSRVRFSVPERSRSLDLITKVQAMRSSWVFAKCIDQHILQHSIVKVGLDWQDMYAPGKWYRLGQVTSACGRLHYMPSATETPANYSQNQSSAILVFLFLQ